MDVEHITTVRTYIRDALDFGSTMRAALKIWRATGGRIRTDDFAALWRDEQRKQRGKGRA